MFKTLFISSEFPPGPGGIGSHAFHICNTLRKRKLWIIICTISDYISVEEANVFDKNSSLKVIRFKRYNNYLYNWYHRIKIVCGIIINENITHVFVSGRQSILLIPIIKLISNVKIATIIHGSEFKVGLVRKFLLLCLRLTDNIITVSNFTKNLIPSKLNINTVVIHNGIDPSEWGEIMNIPSFNNYPILLTVGSISLRKGQHNIINALPYIKKIFPNVHYHCVGETKGKDYLLKQVHDLGLKRNVSIHGIVSKSILKDFYNKAHVNMLLSERTLDGEIEGYGISILEGNIFGVPAIGSNHSGLKESIIPDQNGILVNQDNPEEIINALKRILSNYEEFYNNSIRYAKSNTWDDRIIKYENFIK